MEMSMSSLHKNPILESNVGQTNSKNSGKTYTAQVVSTTKGGMT